MPDGARPLRVLIVDDEPHNRRRIEDLLHDEADVEIAGLAGDGVEAIEMIRMLQPDLVFLDVQMPEKTGLDVVREIGADTMPPTIFVTAYDTYAVAAFDASATDYLVKPFADERFEQALRRARRSLAARAIDGEYERLLAEIGSPRDAASPDNARAAPADGYVERFAVELRGQIFPVAASDVEYITASGPYAELYVAERRYLIREAMHTLEGRLDPSRFMRIHRSAIVRLDRVESMRRAAGGDGEVTLKSGGRLRVSRTRREPLERWLGVAR